MPKIARRFRSASFRAGLTTGLVVVIILVLPLFVAAGAIAIASLPNASDLVVDSGDAIEQGRSPDEVWADVTLPDGQLLVLFDVEGNVVQEIGDAPPAIRQELKQAKFRIDAPIADEDRELVSIGDTEWVIANDEVVAPDGSNYIVALALTFGYSQLPLVTVLVLTMIGLVIFVTPTAIVTAWVVRRSLQRVDAVQTQVQLISSKSLDYRLPTREIADPIDRLPHTMNAMLERLDQAQQQQNQFIADASHELRSPVAGILAQIEVSIQYPDRVDVPELLVTLHTEALRTRTIVQDLLYLSRLEGGQQKKYEYLSASKALELVQVAAERYQSDSWLVETSFDLSLAVFDSEESMATLGLSASHLDRVIQNLLDNAVRHCNRMVKVSVRSDPLPNSTRHLTISVVDDGDGVAEQDRARVFGRFVRLDETRSRDKGGSGLGLAITKELIERAGGTIAIVDSTESKYRGANFECRFPVGYHGQPPT